MTNSKWVTLVILKAVSSHDQQFVSDIGHFVKGSPITSLPMTNSKWVPLDILWKAVSSHLLLLQTECKWHCTFCERQSHHSFSCDQQYAVSDIAHFVKGSLITSFLWPTVCEWHCTFCQIQSHHIFCMANSMWVTLHILWKAVSSHLFLWPTVCEWHHCTFCKMQSHHIFSYDQQGVSDIQSTSSGWQSYHIFSLTNRKWVTLHILWKAVSSHVFLWLTVCECQHCMFCERQSHHLFLWPTGSKWYSTSCERNCVSLHLFLWLTACVWCCTFCERQSHHRFLYN